MSETYTCAGCGATSRSPSRALDHEIACEQYNARMASQTQIPALERRRQQGEAEHPKPPKP